MIAMKHTDRISKILVAYRRRWHWPKPVALIPNVIPVGYGYECDLVEITKAGLWHEFEVKVSRSDFFADFKKKSMWSRDRRPKHEIIQGGGGPNYFWFVTPAGLVEPHEVPEYAGLIEIDVSGECGPKVSTVKHETRLHRNKMPLNSVINLMQKLSSGYYEPGFQKLELAKKVYPKGVCDG